MLKKKIWANFQRIIELFTQKLSLSSQKYGFGIRDPGSEIREKKPILDPGSRGQKGTGSRIRIPNTGLKRRVRSSTQGFGRNFVILSLNMPLSWLPLLRIPSRGILLQICNMYVETAAVRICGGGGGRGGQPPDQLFIY